MLTVLVATMAETNEHIRKLYHETLAARLPEEEDLNNPEKRKRAMAPELEWYTAQVAQCIQVAGEQGKVRSSVKKILKPVFKLVGFYFGLIH